MKYTVILLSEAPDPAAPKTDPDSWPTIVRTGYTTDPLRWVHWVLNVHYMDFFDQIIIDHSPQLLRRGGKIT